MSQGRGHKKYIRLELGLNHGPLYQSRKLGAATYQADLSLPQTQAKKSVAYLKIQPAVVPSSCHRGLYWAPGCQQATSTGMHTDGACIWEVSVHQTGSHFCTVGRAATVSLGGHEPGKEVSNWREHHGKDHRLAAVHCPQRLGRVAAPQHGRPCQAVALPAPVFLGSMDFQGFERAFSRKPGPSPQCLRPRARLTPGSAWSGLTWSLYFHFHS